MRRFLPVILSILLVALLAFVGCDNQQTPGMAHGDADVNAGLSTIVVSTPDGDRIFIVTPETRIVLGNSETDLEFLSILEQSGELIHVDVFYYFDPEESDDEFEATLIVVEEEEEDPELS